MNKARRIITLVYPFNPTKSLFFFLPKLLYTHFYFLFFFSFSNTLQFHQIFFDALAFIRLDSVESSSLVSFCERLENFRFSDNTGNSFMSRRVSPPWRLSCVPFFLFSHSTLYFYFFFCMYCTKRQFHGVENSSIIFSIFHSSVIVLFIIIIIFYFVSLVLASAAGDWTPSQLIPWYMNNFQQA